MLTIGWGFKPKICRYLFGFQHSSSIIDHKNIKYLFSLLFWDVDWHKETDKEQMETKIVLISVQIIQFNILKILDCDRTSFRILKPIKQEKNDKTRRWLL